SHPHPAHARRPCRRRSGRHARHRHRLPDLPGVRRGSAAVPGSQKAWLTLGRSAQRMQSSLHSIVTLQPHLSIVSRSSAGTDPEGPMSIDSRDTRPPATEDAARAPGLLRRRVQLGVCTAGLLVSAVLGPLTDAPTLWGLLPLGLFVVLLLLDLDIVLATVVSCLAAMLILGAEPGTAAGFLGDALGSDVMAIGMIIVLGGGLGEVLTRTGAASDLVQLIMRRLGTHSPVRAQLGIMLASAVLVIALGTLIGAFALAAPLVIPIAARLGFTRSGTALMMFIGGTCGMFVAPFVGSMVAIRTASGITYPDFVLSAGGPLAIACFAVGFFLVRWNLRHPVSQDDYYTAEDGAADTAEVPRHARASTWGF